MKKPLRPVPVPHDLSDYPEEPLHTHRLDALMDAYHAGVNPLFICGIPGSGKTTLAQELARKITGFSPKRSPGKSRTYLLKFCGSIRDTIIRHHIPLYVLLPDEGWGADDEMLDEQCYRDKLQLFRQYAPPKALFILDGVDIPLTELFADPQYEDLLSLGTVIITSRDTLTFPQWVMEPLPESGTRKVSVPHSREERIILQDAALLPPTGMRMTTFLRAHGSNRKDLILNLIRDGSLAVSGLNVLPPDICRGSDRDYEPFLTYLQHRAEQPTLSQILFDQICHTFKNAAFRLEDADGFLAHCAGRLFRERGDYTEAFPLYGQFLARQQALTPEDPVCLARALYENGCIHLFRGTFQSGARKAALQEQATDMLLQALAYQQASLSRGHPDLARTRMALASVNPASCGFEDSAQMAGYALSEQLSEYPEDHYDVAETLLGCAALHPGAFNQRLIRKDFTQRAIAVVDKWDYRDATQADAYSMMSGSLSIAELEQRIAWQQRALEIRKKWIPHGKLDIYEGYLQLIWLAHRAENSALEAETLSAAIELLLQMAPPDHPWIVSHQQALDDIRLPEK